MELVKFSATRLAAKGKKGELKPDADGYYTMIVGGLNAFNSVNQYYTLKGAEKLFLSSSILMRRVKAGNVKGELGHPKRTPGMTDDDYLNRILTIEETNVCCVFGDIWLDPEFGRNNPEYKNPGLVAIMAKIKPSGPKGFSLKASLDNPKENVCFSVRSLTRDYFLRGVKHREIVTLVCFDTVTEPGIVFANKWDSPGLESVEEVSFNRTSIERIAFSEPHSVAMESSKAIATECLHNAFVINRTVTPIYAKW